MDTKAIPTPAQDALREFDSTYQQAKAEFAEHSTRRYRETLTREAAIDAAGVSRAATKGAAIQALVERDWAAGAWTREFRQLSHEAHGERVVIRGLEHKDQALAAAVEAVGTAAGQVRDGYGAERVLEAGLALAKAKVVWSLWSAVEARVTDAESPEAPAEAALRVAEIARRQLLTTICYLDNRSSRQASNLVDDAEKTATATWLRDVELGVA